MESTQDATRAENLHRAELLDTTRWASGFTWQEILQLASYMALTEFPAGTYLCREGKTDRYLYVIVSGSIEVIKESSTQEQSIIATLLKGQTLGEMSLIDGEPRSASARAQTNCQVLALSSLAFNRLLEEKPRLGIGLLLKLSWLMSQRIRATSGVLADVLSTWSLAVDQDTPRVTAPRRQTIEQARPRPRLVNS